MQKFTSPSRYIFRGARGKIDIERVSGNVYLYDATYIMSKDHIVIAFYNALRAFETGKNISSKIHIETMLYLAGSRQIDYAKKLYEPKKEGTYAIICENPSDLEELINTQEIELDDSVLEINEEKLRAFNLKGLFRENPVMYFIERMAILNVKN